MYSMTCPEMDNLESPEVPLLAMEVLNKLE
jgi:hypothetical protein